MAVSGVKVRAFFGAVFAVIVLILFASFATTSLGMNIPILRDIGAAIGATPSE